MTLSYDFPYRLIVTIANFHFFGCFVTKKNSYSYSILLFTFSPQVAQTRLENRTNRVNNELCRDIPQYQLCHEVQEIDASARALIKKLEVSESALRYTLFL